MQFTVSDVYNGEIIYSCLIQCVRQRFPTCGTRIPRGTRKFSKGCKINHGYIKSILFSFFDDFVDKFNVEIIKLEYSLKKKNLITIIQNIFQD